MKKTLALALALAFVASPVLAFHDGGVARCSGCHTMHNSQNGALVDVNSPNGNAYLLKDATASDVCLSCHATSRGNSLGGGTTADPLNPGPTYGAGQFIYLTEDNLNDGRGAAISGDAAGHNLNAPGYGIATDATLSAAPGGTFPASAMGCSSCHDPHGTADYRLLYGAGRSVQDGLYTFTNAAPVAEHIGLSGTGEANDLHVAYKGGMSAWCGNCHGDFHANNTKLVHPSGRVLGATIAQNYGLYNGTEDVRGGTPATSYLAAVPFEDAAMTTTSTAGPSASSQVACISCHRAHASSAPDAGRWDFAVGFLEEDGVNSGSYAIPDPYSSPNQRSLCNKCHVKDEFDHIVTVVPAP